MSPIRRTVDAILAAHRMDPQRRELYVEGSRDVMFLLWLLGDDLDSDTLIREIDTVEQPDVAFGGERSRVLAFAAVMVDQGVQVRCLVDANGAAELLPPNTWQTDLRDLEWYVLREDCLQKVMSLGVGRGNPRGLDVLNAALQIGRIVAAIRVVSLDLGLELPVSDAELHKWMTVASPLNVRLQTEKFVTALLQAAGISLRCRAQVLNEVHRQLESVADKPASEVVRGKDAFAVLGEILMSLCGLHRKDGYRLLWTSFDRSLAGQYPTLVEVIDYLAGRRSVAV